MDAKRLGARSEAMKEEMGEGPEAELGSGGAGGAPGRDQPGAGKGPQEGPEEPGRGRQQRWEAQWQHFLQALQAPPHLAWESSQGSEDAPWEDAKAFLASFEQVATACGWPQGEWVARLLPALSGEAQQAFVLLAAGDQEDYGTVKAAILRGQALRREAQRQHFRQFCCPPELGEPRRLYGRLQELCCQWLRPERHTKEQILELLVLEQFLASLPGEVQSWVRAGGPDSGAQAVALLEECLASRREADTGTLQEWALGPLDAKEEPLDGMQGEISKRQAEICGHIQQNINGEVPVPGTGIARPTSFLPPEGQDVAEAELTEALGVQVDQVTNPRKICVPLHVLGQTPMQSSQWITFWKVLPEEDRDVETMEGPLGPQLGLAPHPVKKEETFLLDPLQSLRLPGQGSDDGKGNGLKVKNSQLGGNESVEIPRRGRGRTHENVPVTVEMLEKRCKSNSRQGTERCRGCKESGGLPERLGAACSIPSPEDTEGERASFSKYSRKYCPKSRLVFEHSGEEYNESFSLEEKVRPKSDLDEHHNGCVEEKNHDCPEFGVSPPSNSLGKHQTIHAGEKTYKCTECAKSFSERADLLQHWIHTGKKPHPCPQCGKSFSKRSDLLRHLSIHTGEKPHKCPNCGKSFSQRSSLLTHQMIHTGEKPHKCSECGKGFTRRSKMVIHQVIHTGKKPHQCLECGKSFSFKSSLLNHLMFHTGEKPHKCLSCGKSFYRRSDLLRHETIHTRKTHAPKP